jgi:hypothetical protein
MASSPARTKILLKSAEVDGDGESVNVRFNVYRPLARESIPFTFQVKRTDSLDEAVDQALAQFRELVAEIHLALAEGLQR